MAALSWFTTLAGAEFSNFEQTLRAYWDRHGGTIIWPEATDGQRPGNLPPDGFYAAHCTAADLPSRFNSCVSKMMEDIEAMTKWRYTNADFLENLGRNEYNIMVSNTDWNRLHGALGGTDYFSSLATKSYQEKFQAIQMILERIDDCYVNGGTCVNIPTGITVTLTTNVPKPSDFSGGVSSVSSLKAFYSVRGAQPPPFPTTASDSPFVFHTGGLTQSVLTTASGLDEWADAFLFYKCSYNNKPGGSSPKTSCVDSGASLQSAHYAWSLGQALFGHRSGSLKLHYEVADPSWYSPDSLSYSTEPGFGVVRDGSGHLTQAYGPNVVANVTVVDSTHYQLKFYVRGADVNGVVQTSGSPYLTYDIANPDAANSQNRLRITKNAGSSSEAWSDFSYDVSSKTWTLARSDDPVVETIVKPDWQSTTDNQGNITRTYRTIVRAKTLNGALVSKISTTVDRFAWGEEKTSEVVDPEGAALTTAWTYYTDSANDGANYAMLKQMTAPSGYWEIYTYDSIKRLSTKTSSYLDGAQTADRKILTVSYSTDNDGNPVTSFVTTIRGTEVSRSYRKDRWDGHDDYVCQTTGASISASDNLVTHVDNYLVTNTSSGALAGGVKSMTRPDGTATLYSYFPDQVDSNLSLDPATSLTTVAKQGQANNAWPNATGITDGTITTTIANIPGEIVSSTVQDVVSGLTIAQDQAASVNGVDGLGRPILVNHYNGTSTARSYDCCQLGSETDAFGVVTAYANTASSNSVTRLGITTKVTTAGLTTATTRTGTDNSQMTLSTVTYDAAGRVVSTAGGDNHATTHSYSYDGSGHLTDTRTNPDGGTVVVTYYRDGQVKSVTGTATAQLRRYVYDVDQNGLFTQIIALDASGNDTSETSKSYVDAVGRAARQVNAAGGVSLSTFNASGQLTKVTDPDGVTGLFGYDGQGRRTVTAVDMNQNGSIDNAGTDRIALATPEYATKSGVKVARVTTKVWDTLNSDSSTIYEVVETGLSGLTSWSTTGGQTTVSALSISNTAGTWTETTTNPDNSFSIKNYSGGRLSSEQTKNASGEVIASMSYDYDAHGRIWQTHDGRGAVVQYGYDAADRVHTITGPAPTSGGTAPVTTIDYDNNGRRATITDTASGTVTYAYYPTGAVQTIGGTRSYPISYTYTPQGRLYTMTTASGTTTWVYDPTTGRLWKKLDAANKGPIYTYTSAGRLLTKTNARGTVATYGYDNAGGTASITYDDGITPSVTNTFNRLGQAATIASGGVTETLAFDAWNQLQGESFSGGLLSGLSITHSYDSLKRLSGVSSSLGSSGISSQSYSYDGASRLATVTGGNETATYSYDPNASMVTQVAMSHTTSSGTTTLLTSSRSYDLRGRLLWVKSLNAQNSSVFLADYSQGQGYDSIDRRSGVTREDGSRWSWGYDNRSEVTSGSKLFSDNTAHPVLQFGYSFDGIGNRTSSVKGANDSTHTASYTTNSRNQYSGRTVPPYLAVIGDAASDANVVVQAQPATRKGTAFWREWSEDNSSGPVRENVRVAAAKPGAGTGGADLASLQTGKLYLPPATESFAYDDDGNLTGDSRWTYTWDAENRLLSMQENSATLPSGWVRQRLEFGYDAGSRRTRKTVKQWNGSAWQVTADTGFVYDGWNLIAELSLTGSSPQLVRSYCWGLDLSQTLQGAGGVGGLLWVTSSSGVSNYIHYSAYDGNGNVIGWMDAASGSPVMKLDYDPFGVVVMAGGTNDATSSAVARAIPFRFSTKYTDRETDLNYYGLRFYSANLGRWINRDPIEEAGGANLYGMVRNRAVDLLDYLGRDIIPAVQRPGVVFDTDTGLFLAINPSGQLVPLNRPPQPDDIDPVGEAYGQLNVAQRASIGLFHAFQQIGYGEGRLASNLGCFGKKLYDHPLDTTGELIAGLVKTPVKGWGKIFSLLSDPSYRSSVGDKLRDTFSDPEKRDKFLADLEAGIIFNGLTGSALAEAKAAIQDLKASMAGDLAVSNGAPKVKYIGRMEDLEGIPRSQTLLDDLPNLGSPRANYYQNSSVLRKALRDGYEIRDASAFRPNSELAPTPDWPTRTIGQTFTGAERLILDNKGLKLSSSGAYVPK